MSKVDFVAMKGRRIKKECSLSLWWPNYKEEMLRPATI